MTPQYINIEENGSKFYYSDKELKILHREDGPAIEWVNGDKEWYINNKQHREDGPAIEWTNGNTYWYLNGVEYSEEEFNEKMNNYDTIDVQLAQADKDAEQAWERWAAAYLIQREKMQKYFAKIRKDGDEASLAHDEALSRVQKLREIVNNRKLK